MSNVFIYAVKCVFSRSDGGPSPAVPLPVPPNDSGVEGTVEGFGVDTNQIENYRTRNVEKQKETCIIPIDNIHFLFIRMRWRTNQLNDIIIIKRFTF
jgi:hypothetical protein